MSGKADTLFERRRRRVRTRLARTNKGRPRLSVFRSSKHIYAQIIDDVAGHTLASASSVAARRQVRRQQGSGRCCG
jgi:large subunit ribosomal protein L18